MNDERRHRRRLLWMALVAVAAAVAATAPVLAARLDMPPPPPLPGSVPTLDAAHVPVLLNLPGEAVVLRYDVYCVNDSGDCSPSGTVYARAGQSGVFRTFPLQVDTGVSP